MPSTVRGPHAAKQSHLEEARVRGRGRGRGEEEEEEERAGYLWPSMILRMASSTWGETIGKKGFEGLGKRVLKDWGKGF